MTSYRVWIGVAVVAASIAVGQGMSAAQICPPNAAICRTAAKSVFAFKNRSDDNNDRIVWRWLRGQATTTAEFLEPRTTASTALCLYAGTAQALIGESTVPPSGTLWQLGDNDKLWYKDPSGAADGVRYVLLRSGAAGKARIIAKEKGSALPDLPTPFPIGLFPITVQLHQDDGPECWGSSFSNAKINTDTRIKARNP